VRLAREALRFFIAVVLVVTGLAKLLDVFAFARIIGTYGIFTDPVLLPLAVLVPVAELALSSWLLSGRRLFAAALTAFAMHAVYAGWAASAVLRGLNLSNCGCFGAFFPRPLGWSTVVEDLAMAFLCGTLAALSRPALSREPRSA
jgi:hypothetical protein